MTTLQQAQDTLIKSILTTFGNPKAPISKMFTVKEYDRQGRLIQTFMVELNKETLKAWRDEYSAKYHAMAFYTMECRDYGKVIVRVCGLYPIFPSNWADMTEEELEADRKAQLMALKAKYDHN